MISMSHFKAQTIPLFKSMNMTVRNTRYILNTAQVYYTLKKNHKINIYTETIRVDEDLL